MTKHPTELSIEERISKLEREFEVVQDNLQDLASELGRGYELVASNRERIDKINQSVGKLKNGKYSDIELDVFSDFKILSKLEIVGYIISILVISAIAIVIFMIF